MTGSKEFDGCRLMRNIVNSAFVRRPLGTAHADISNAIGNTCCSRMSGNDSCSPIEHNAQ